MHILPTNGQIKGNVLDLISHCYVKKKVWIIYPNSWWMIVSLRILVITILSSWFCIVNQWYCISWICFVLWVFPIPIFLSFWFELMAIDKFSTQRRKNPPPYLNVSLYQMFHASILRSLCGRRFQILVLLFWYAILV
jgi:hypothetical protein